jgi:hypothetical protein
MKINKTIIVSFVLLSMATLLVPIALADPAHCKVTGGGWIIPSGGTDKATFGFNAMQYTPGQTPYPTPPVKGELEYIDHNTGMTVHGIVNSFVYVHPDPFEKNQKADFGGTCTVNGVSGFTFVVHVVDNGEPGKADTFQIVVFGVYDSGLQVLGGGNIQTHPLPAPLQP